MTLPKIINNDQKTSVLQSNLSPKKHINLFLCLKEKAVILIKIGKKKLAITLLQKALEKAKATNRTDLVTDIEDLLKADSIES